MTFVEKAIERLNKLIEQSAEGSEEQTDYVVMKQACEKQMPQKPNALDCCTKCDTYLKDDNGVEGDYCPNCGQKIDWGDE